MKKQFKRILKKTFPGLAAYVTLIMNKDSFLHSSGWMESLKRGYPCRRDGSELPWMNYSVIAFLEKQLRKDLTLFEYGSGYSTFFYSRLVGKVTCVEHNRSWYESLEKKIPANVKLIFIKQDYGGDYCRSITLNGQQYDVVVVDGRDRVNCIKQSIEHLSVQGVILLDDSDRDNYSQGIEHAKEAGFLALDFEGLKPTGSGSHKTTIFYRNHNCLGI
jgi:hypothetical protein